MSFKKVYAVIAVGATFVGTQSILRNLSDHAPRRPSVHFAIANGLRAAAAQTQKPVPDGKVLAWSTSTGIPPLSGTATIIDHDSVGCYTVEVRPNLKTGYRSEATYRVCP